MIGFVNSTRINRQKDCSFLSGRCIQFSLNIDAIIQFCCLVVLFWGMFFFVGLGEGGSKRLSKSISRKGVALLFLLREF